MKTLNEFEHILVVDDDEISAEIASIVLLGASYNRPLDIVYNGQQAIDFLVKNCVKQAGKVCCPTLVFLDLNMPIMDGFEFLEAFTQEKKLQQAQIAIIILTSSAHIDDKQRTNTYPIAGYIEKPLTEQKIKAVLG